MDQKEAEEIVRKAQKDRVDSCYQEIDAILKKYSCTLEPQITIRGTEIIKEIVIIPNKT